jgi:hypothetical protein
MKTYKKIQLVRHNDSNVTMELEKIIEKRTELAKEGQGEKLSELYFDKILVCRCHKLVCLD